MNKFFIGLISIYQRYISPYKGFQCAHAYLHQGDSCSAAIKTIIADQGIIQGYGDIRHRFEACRYAYDDIQRQERKERKRKDRNDVCNTCSNS
ncbi:MAG TPA: membrane protein insertion efficiency factor YidD, partial [Thiothrix sp.]|nr:membrane protein insertion efficiency factor YidD [Thiothrix sp.]